MKTLAASLFALTFAAVSSFAGGFGPGPWANGAYYDGQFNGLYSASVYGANITGVVGFGLNNGAPSTGSSTNAATFGTVNFDSSKNYYAIFVAGSTYTGTTLGNLNIDTKKVTGAFMGDSFTTTNTSLSGGAFTANLNSYKSVVSFDGNGTLSDDGTTIFPFGINGIKTSN
jgi:hypothetical protein